MRSEEHQAPVSAVSDTSDQQPASDPPTCDRRPATGAPPRELRRIVVVGTTGTGKTTTARRIAATIGAPHVELDALHWEADWTEADTETFRRRIVEATSGPRWVVDGNYATGRDLVWQRADLIVWLDFSIARIYRNLFVRTTRRVVTREELWAGNRERLRTAFFSRESLFVWALQTHWRKRRTYPEAFASPELAHVRTVRLRSPRAAEAFLRALAERVEGSPER